MRLRVVPLYLRIWLAVIVTVGMLTLAFAWLLRQSWEQQQPPAREVVIRDERDQVIGQSMVRPNRVRGQGIEFDVALNDGRTITVQLPPRQRPPPGLALRRAGAAAAAGSGWRAAAPAATAVPAAA